MKKLRLSVISIVCFCAGFNESHGQALSENDYLKLVSTIPLPNVAGRIDHLSFDSKNQQIFVAALGNNTVEVVDLTNKKVIHTLKNLSEPQGIKYIPEKMAVVVANGGSGECDLISAESFQKVSSVKLAGDADNVRYDSAAGKIYIGYGDGGIAIIDAPTFKLISEIKLSGHPESFQIDKAEQRIYVNVPDEQQIEIIDVTKNIIDARWKITEAKSNFPMALDETNHRLFIGCRNPAKLIVKDTKTGNTVSVLDIDGDVDDIFYDKSSKQIYLSCGAGSINIIKQTDANNYQSNGKIQTHKGARTSLFIPEISQLVIAVPSGLNGDAALLIYQIKK
jgi:DNA-binding beta-propeller fold protein YncE